jgi:hypothetical protein
VGDSAAIAIRMVRALIVCLDIGVRSVEKNFPEKRIARAETAAGRIAF